MTIKKSCKYCGKIHEEGYICPQKPTYKKKQDEIVRFRNSGKWHKKRKQIKKRDNNLCQICIRNLYNTARQYNANQLEVHHAIPIKENDTVKLSSSNLITVCAYHHEMCEKGKIPYDEVKMIIEKQEKNNPPTYVLVKKESGKTPTAHIQTHRKQIT